MLEFLSLALIWLYSLDHVASGYVECPRGKPCSFLGKDFGWQVWEESDSFSLQIPPVNDNWKKSNTKIFLAISSYRDKLCPITLYNLYHKSEFPDRVFAGVVQQNDDTVDLDCFYTYCKLVNERDNKNYTLSECPYANNIRMTRIHAKEAKGPTWARAKGMTMLDDEEFCMQTDSHMDFEPRWDSKMLAMWADTGNEYAVLSTYVSDLAQYEDNMDGKKGVNGAFEVPNLCMITLGGMWGMPRVHATKCLRLMPKPKLTNAVWGAGLSFSKCHAERKVPYDPHTPHIFDGEEFSRAIRFWTHGYDIYTPHRVYILHNYKDSQADPVRMGWGRADAAHQKIKQEEQHHSVKRIQMLLDMPHENRDAVRILEMQKSKYGLGDRRSLSQAIQFSGVDTRNLKQLGNRCGNLDYVPFTPHPWGPDYVPTYSGGQKIVPPYSLLSATGKELRDGTVMDTDLILNGEDPAVIAAEIFTDVRDPGSIYFDPNDEAMVEAWNRANTARLGAAAVPYVSSAVVLKKQQQQQQQEQQQQMRLRTAPPKPVVPRVIPDQGAYRPPPMQPSAGAGVTNNNNNNKSQDILSGVAVSDEVHPSIHKRFEKFKEENGHAEIGLKKPLHVVTPEESMAAAAAAADAALKKAAIKDAKKKEWEKKHGGFSVWMTILINVSVVLCLLLLVKYLLSRKDMQIMVGKVRKKVVGAADGSGGSFVKNV